MLRSEELEFQLNKLREEYSRINNSIPYSSFPSNFPNAKIRALQVKRNEISNRIDKVQAQINQARNHEYQQKLNDEYSARMERERNEQQE
jgi:chromosome segregation ATPase